MKEGALADVLWWPRISDSIASGQWGHGVVQAWAETALAGRPAMVILRYAEDS